MNDLPMSLTVTAPHDLRALLATMKSAKEQRVNMCIWDRDIKAVEDAIAAIEVIQSQPASREEPKNG
jgi:hypothetical protein